MNILMVLTSHDKLGNTGLKTGLWLEAGVLHRVIYKSNPLVKGKRVTGFTNAEEEEVKLTQVVPFLVEDELKRLGGRFEKAPNWQSFVVVDGRLITGQNPASSQAAAQTLLKAVSEMAHLHL